jgi:NADH-quinone oxidoreductase subunit F
MALLFKELQDIQDKYGYLDKDELGKLDKSLPNLIGTASFYSFFKLEKDSNEENHIENIFPCRKKGLLLNPDNIHTAKAISIAIDEPEKVIAQLKKSSLCGRGGALFPTGIKWEGTAHIEANQKYVICNADEGEPDTGKDRVMLEENPQAVITGIAICAAVVGANKAYIYLRGEYKDLREKLELTISELTLQPQLDITIVTGMGAYICGEETALLESIEGNRPEPRLKPPFPGVAGLYGCPTIINNVETFAAVAYIVSNGVEAFINNGDITYPGYKLYTVAGDVEQPGVYEAPTGVTVENLLQMAGGIRQGLKLLAIQVGGGSGRLLSRDALSMVMTPQGCKNYGTTLGTGSCHFFAQGSDLRQYAVDKLKFYKSESCGCCVPCRNGLQELTEMLEDGETDDRDILELAQYVKLNARCALAPAAVTPVISLIEGGFSNEDYHRR